MIISSKVEPADLGEGERLSRYSYAFLLHMLQHSHIWIIAFSAISLTIAALLGRATGEWKTILTLYGTLAAGFLVRAVAIFFQRRRKAQKMNREIIGVELTNEGVRFHQKNKPVRFAEWSRYLNTRAGERVLLLSYRSTQRKFRKDVYLLLPIHSLTHAERYELLSCIPERIRSQSVQRALAKWKLS